METMFTMYANSQPLSSTL